MGQLSACAGLSSWSLLAADLAGSITPSVYPVPGFERLNEILSLSLVLNTDSVLHDPFSSSFGVESVLLLRSLEILALRFKILASI